VSGPPMTLGGVFAAGVGENLLAGAAVAAGAQFSENSFVNIYDFFYRIGLRVLHDRLTAQDRGNNLGLINQRCRSVAGERESHARPAIPLSSPRTFPRFPPENEVRCGLSAGGNWIRTPGSPPFLMDGDAPSKVGFPRETGENMLSWMFTAHDP
jgi:hypothetical protein